LAIVAFGVIFALSPAPPTPIPFGQGTDASVLTTIIQYEGAVTRLSPVFGIEVQESALSSLTLSSHKITESDLDAIWRAVARGDLCDTELQPLVLRLLNGHRAAFLARFDADRAAAEARLNSECFSAFVEWAAEARDIESRKPPPKPPLTHEELLRGDS
jgi:hypothetical protein